jgi:hypothetical protein
LKRLKEEVRKAALRITKAKQRKQDRKALKSFIIDSGATSHYVRTADNLPVIGPSNKEVHLPNGQVVKATAQVKLPFNIKDSARIAELVPGITANSLVSVGKLADAGYTTVFLPQAEGVLIVDSNSGEMVLQGWREEGGSKLWRLEDESTIADENEHDGLIDGSGEPKFYEEVHVNDSAGNVYDLPSIEMTVKYLHASLGYPTKSTLLKAIKNGNLLTFPGLTVGAVQRHFPEYAHLRREAPLAATSSWAVSEARERREKRYRAAAIISSPTTIRFTPLNLQSSSKQLQSTKRCTKH